MLPLDVIDHILGFLQGDLAALTCCSQAHPFLSKIAERHLYTHITVEDQSTSYSEPYIFDQFQLFKILRDNPRIGKYVRSLRVEVSRPSGKSSKQQQTLHLILPMLPLLEHIFLACPTGVERPIWAHLPKKFQIAFMDCLRLPTIKELSLSDITDFPLSSLDHSHTLKKLTLRGGMSFNDPDSSPSSRPSFDSLSLFRCSVYHKMSSWAKTQTLRSLKMDVRETDLIKLPSLLQPWSSSLTSLDLDLGYGFRSEVNLAHERSTSSDPRPLLPKLPVLEQITIHSTISLHHQIWVRHKDKEVLRSYKSAFPVILALIFELTSPSLKRITLSFHLTFNGPFSFSDMDWSPIDTLSQLGIPLELRISANQTTFHIPPVDILESLRKVDSLSKLVEQHALVLKGEELTSFNLWVDMG